MADRHKNRTLESEAMRQRERRDEGVSIDSHLADARAKINWRRRRKAEKSFPAWMETYGVGVFIDDPPPKPHGVEILEEMETAANDSRPYQILVARGGGKTSYTEGYVVYSIVNGKCKLVVVTSINAKQAQQIVREISAIFDSEPFATDYPDVALPIKLLDGHGRRAQRYRGKDTKVRIVTDEVQLPTIEDEDGPSVASGACIRAKALKSVRGTKNGTQRPDLVILDDTQTREIAENDERVNDVLRLIKGDVMGLAGKGKMGIISTATPIAAEDVTYQLAHDKTWKTTRFPAIIKWPDEWAKDGHGLWGEYFRMFDEENAEDAKHTRKGGSLSFYRANKAAMDAGADILNWGNYDRRGGQISGLQKLMDKYHEMGHADFMAEYMMQPQRQSFVFELTPQTVVSRVRIGVPPCTVPGDSVLTVAATDINPAYGLSTVAVSFDVNLTGLVVAYKVFKTQIDSRLNDVAFNAEVNRALNAHAREVAALGFKVDRWGIDAGGRQFNVVTKFAPISSNQYGIDTVAMLGRAGQNWNPNVRSRIREALNGTILCRDERGRKWLAFNADEKKEVAQRAWGTDVGGDGGLSLFDGGVNHSKFAIQITNEKLVEKAKMRNPRGGGEEQFVYRWKSKNPHDFLDCLAMCYALAAAKNLTGDGNYAAAGSGKNRRKVWNG